MYRIRIHGRGGQGAKTAAHIIAEAAFLEGKYSQAFALYGAERRGAPVAAFVRIDDQEILKRGYIHDPDFFIILDDSLLAPGQIKEIGIVEGLDRGDIFIVNTDKQKIDALKEFEAKKIVLIDATCIALDTLKKPIFNTAMIGAFVKVTGLVKLETMKEAMERVLGTKKPHLIKANMEAIQRCYDAVKV